jgi:TPR repeat protein
MRCLLLLAGCLAAGLASAQSEGDRQFEAGRTADRENWEWRAKQGLQPTEAEKASQAVVDAIAQRDCARAASQLNAGVAKGYPELMLLAGAMYEDGVCLKPSWERAISFYEKAAAAGRPEAVARIAAGYAAPAGGRDAAAALWWALEARTALPAACTQVVAVADDADRFVNASKAWPARQVGACVYVADAEFVFMAAR